MRGMNVEAIDGVDRSDQDLAQISSGAANGRSLTYTAPTPLRPVRGRPWLPGQSGNPGGRSPAFGSLVREQTRQGAELVMFMLRVLRGESRVGGRRPTLPERMAAAGWLADRGWGKPVQAMEHAAEDGGPLRIQIEYVDAALQDGGYPAS